MSNVSSVTQQKKDKMCANKSNLVDIINQHQHGNINIALTEWCEVTKGRVYDFTIERTFNSVETGEPIDNRAFLNDEMRFWHVKLESNAKSWSGTVANLIKNVNARRYKLVCWDISEQQSHTRTVKARQTKGKKASVKSRANQKIKRQTASALKKHQKLMETFKPKLNQLLADKLEAIENLEDFMGISVAYKNHKEWTSQRKPDGRKWWKSKNSVGFSNKEAQVYVTEKREMGKVKQAETKAYWANKRMKEKMAFYAIVKVGIVPAGPESWNIARMGHRQKRVRRVSESPF